MLSILGKVYFIIEYSLSASASFKVLFSNTLYLTPLGAVKKVSFFGDLDYVFAVEPSV